MPSLARLIARGDALSCASTSFDAQVLARFGIDDARAPIAALTALADGLDPGEHYWLRIEPVSLRATRTRMHLAVIPAGDISAEEAHALAEPLRVHFGALGYELIVSTPGRWYLRCARPADISTLPPSACVGLVTEQHLPTGADAAGWRTWITEAQMLLHGHDVNAAREAIGKLPVNAVWPWGGGRLPNVQIKPFEHVFSADALASGLARLSGAYLAAVPHDAIALFNASLDKDALLVLSLADASVHGLGLDAYDTLWFAAIEAALRRRRLRAARLTLVSHNATIARHIVPSHLLRFWRTPGGATDHA
jgi:hypothetical protein